MTDFHALLLILAIALATVLTRAVPFLLFPPGKPVPSYITYLGTALPCATIGMLVVYCVRGATPLAWPHGLPELLAVGLVALVQLWKRNTLLSIVSGTALYMVLVQTVFA